MANTTDQQIETMQNILGNNLHRCIQRLREIRTIGVKGGYFIAENLNPKNLFTPHFSKNRDSPLVNTVICDTGKIEDLEQEMEILQSNDALRKFAQEMKGVQLMRDGGGWNIHDDYFRLECLYLCCLADGEISTDFFFDFFNIRTI